VPLGDVGAGDSKLEPADLELVRVSIRDEGAFGVLLVRCPPPGQDALPLAVCLERTYEQLALKIPPGRYRCVRTRFIRGGYDTYEITGVAGHSRLLFHRGNVEQDLEGCVAVGKSYGFVNAKPGVIASGEAFAGFMKWADGREAFSLLVRHAA
jgi:hypothetical protein